MRTIQADWEKYKTMTLPPGAPENQIRDLQRAFYAGALIQFEDLANIPDSMSEEAACQIMAGYEAELRTFFEEVRREVLLKAIQGL